MARCSGQRSLAAGSVRKVTLAELYTVLTLCPSLKGASGKRKSLVIPDFYRLFSPGRPCQLDISIISSMLNGHPSFFRWF